MSAYNGGSTQQCAARVTIRAGVYRLLRGEARRVWSPTAQLLDDATGRRRWHFVRRSGIRAVGRLR